MTEPLHFHFSLSCIGEGNGNPLQCSCLENPRDGRAGWAAVSGVTQSWTQLKQLSSSSSSSIGTTDIMIKVEPLTNFTKQALLDRTKAIQALNEEQIQMRKAVIQNRMALDILTAAQGGTCAIIKVECCVCIPDLSGNVSTALDDMKNR